MSEESPTQTLAERLTSVMGAYGLSVRRLAELSGVEANAIQRAKHGKAVVYEAGARLDHFLSKYREPRRWRMRGCESCQGNAILSSHRCTPVVVGSKLAPGEEVAVIEAMPHEPPARDTGGKAGV